MLMASAIARVLPEFQKKLELNFTEMYNEEELYQSTGDWDPEKKQTFLNTVHN